MEKLGEFIRQFIQWGLAELCRCFLNPSQGMGVPTVQTYTLFLVCLLAAGELNIFIVDFTL